MIKFLTPKKSYYHGNNANIILRRPLQSDTILYIRNFIQKKGKVAIVRNFLDLILLAPIQASKAVF